MSTEKRGWGQAVGVILFLTLILWLAITQAGCTPQLPVAETMKTGEVVKTPRQYEEFCRERDEHNICPEVENASTDE